MVVTALLGEEADPMRLVRFDGDALARDPAGSPRRPTRSRCSAAACVIVD